MRAALVRWGMCSQPTAPTLVAPSTTASTLAVFGRPTPRSALRATVSSSSRAAPVPTAERRHQAIADCQEAVDAFAASLGPAGGPEATRNGTRAELATQLPAAEWEAVGAQRDVGGRAVLGMLGGTSIAA